MSRVTNPTNVGAIFRSAAALGMDAVLLTEDCSDPLYHRAARVSVGNVFQVPWTYIRRNKNEPAGSWIRQLKQAGFYTAAMALREDALPVDAPELKEKERIAMLLGNESYGLSEEEIDACDCPVIIPMEHEVDSLNVAAASAVAFWEITRRS